MATEECFSSSFPSSASLENSVFQPIGKAHIMLACCRVPVMPGKQSFCFILINADWGETLRNGLWCGSCESSSTDRFEVSGDLQSLLEARLCFTISRVTKKEADLDGREFVSGVKQPGLHLPLRLTGCGMEPPLHQERPRSAPGSL